MFVLIKKEVKNGSHYPVIEPSKLSSSHPCNNHQIRLQTKETRIIAGMNPGNISACVYTQTQVISSYSAMFDNRKQLTKP